MSETFIYQSYLQDPSVCDALIAYHDANPDKQPGRVMYDGGFLVDKTIKSTTESFLTEELADAYIPQLQQVVEQYITKYPACNRFSRWGIVIPPQIQKYEPAEAYFNWHCERDAAYPDSVNSRHLVFMTYLNDVTDAGETEFFNQELKVKPRKGLTLIWPADWTHTHRGVPSPTQEKYIVTGWFNYL